MSGSFPPHLEHFEKHREVVRVPLVVKKRAGRIALRENEWQTGSVISGYYDGSCSPTKNTQATGERWSHQRTTPYSPGHQQACEPRNHTPSWSHLTQRKQGRKKGRGGRRTEPHAGLPNRKRASWATRAEWLVRILCVGEAGSGATRGSDKRENTDGACEQS